MSPLNIPRAQFVMKNILSRFGIVPDGFLYIIITIFGITLVHLCSISQESGLQVGTLYVPLSLMVYRKAVGKKALIMHALLNTSARLISGW